jgi:hypothetical protein
MGRPFQLKSQAYQVKPWMMDKQTKRNLVVMGSNGGVDGPSQRRKELYFSVAGLNLAASAPTS